MPACADDCKRVRLAVFDGRVNEQGTEPLNALFGERGTLRGLRLELATTRAGLDWSVGLSVQRYAPGPRPSVGLQASVLVPLGAAGALLD